MDKVCELVEEEFEFTAYDEAGEPYIAKDKRFVQRERDCTPEEQAEIDARRAQAPMLAKIERMETIKAELSALDTKRIRPMVEGDTDYLATLNQQVTNLRTEYRQLATETAGFTPV
jgi:hypothetical protein